MNSAASKETNDDCSSNRNCTNKPRFMCFAAVSVWEQGILTTEVHRTVDIDSEIARKLFLAPADAILVVAKYSQDTL